MPGCFFVYEINVKKVKFDLTEKKFFSEKPPTTERLLTELKKHWAEMDDGWKNDDKARADDDDDDDDDDVALVDGKDNDGYGNWDDDALLCILLLTYV